MTPTKIIILLTGTIFILLFTWFVSLRQRRYHGIPRFFVFEGLLLLGLTQADVWFKDPLIPRQVITWILLVLSIVYAFESFRLYFRHTKPDLDFENSTRLVTSGLYKYIRHPMYASLLFLGWGMFLKEINPLTISVIIIITIAVFLTCKVEEKEMITRFAEEYREYMKKTKLWIPGVV
jgi:protein-S-isoprenylcysteine O-methyltransferase Ste14